MESKNKLNSKGETTTESVINNIVNVYGEVNGNVAAVNTGAMSTYNLKEYNSNTTDWPPEFDQMIQDINNTISKSQNKVRVYSWDELEFSSIYVVPFLGETPNAGEESKYIGNNKQPCHLDNNDSKIVDCSVVTNSNESVLVESANEDLYIEEKKEHDTETQSNIHNYKSLTLPRKRWSISPEFTFNFLDEDYYRKRIIRRLIFRDPFFDHLIGYHDINLYKRQRETELSISERRERIGNIFSYDDIIYVVGGSGYGKSLFLKSLCVNPKILNGFDEKPLLIIRGDIKKIIRNDGTFKPMSEFLEECFINGSLKDPNELYAGFLNKCLSAGRCLVLLDALDEVGNDQRNELHNLIISYFEDTFPNNKVCITSRERGFIPRENITCFYIRPVTKYDVNEYVDLFIKLKKFNSDEKEKFISQASNLVDRGFIKGFLTLSLLLAIYKNEEDLPTNKVLLYEKCFEYIATTREKNKKLLRNSSTGEEYDWPILTKFMTDATFMELAKLGTPNNSDIPENDINELMLTLYRGRFDSPTECRFATEMFLQFCTDRTEVFVPSPNSNTEYRFFHRSFYEFFFAKYIDTYTNTVEDTYEMLNDFDIDSELFELLVTLYERRKPKYLQDLLSYAFEKAERAISMNTNNSEKRFDILTLIMQTVDDKYSNQRFTKLFLQEGEFISKLSLSVDFKLISNILTQDIAFFAKQIEKNNQLLLSKIQSNIIDFLIKNNAYCKNIIKELKCGTHSEISVDKIKSEKGFSYCKLQVLLPDSYEQMDKYFEKLADRKYLIAVKKLKNRTVNEIFEYATEVNALSTTQRVQLYNSILSKA